MNGSELARKFYEEFGEPMLKEQFPELMPYLAVGFVGSGSERYGFDDMISRDHDFEAGFGIYLPGEDIIDRRQAFLLERVYNKLPKEFEGVKRPLLSPVGGNRNGPVRISDFYLSKVGSADGELTAEQWLTLPDYVLSEATNGEVFYDGYGLFTRIRENLLNMPEDIRLKKLAGNLLLMAQSGQYNYMRCVSRGFFEAAQFACNEFVNAAVKSLFLLAKRYMPYYKWSFRALSGFEDSEICQRLSFLILSGADDSDIINQKYQIIEEICSDVIEKLQAQDLTRAICGDMEKHAYSVNDGIGDSEIRNLNILISV